MLVITDESPAGAPNLIAYQTPARYMPCREIPMSSEARKSSRDNLIGARTASAIAKRMSAAAINLIARK
jgi:hypothetical protein